MAISRRNVAHTSKGQVVCISGKTESHLERPFWSADCRVLCVRIMNPMGFTGA